MEDGSILIRETREIINVIQSHFVDKCRLLAMMSRIQIEQLDVGVLRYLKYP